MLLSPGLFRDLSWSMIAPLPEGVDIQIEHDYRPQWLQGRMCSLRFGVTMTAVRGFLGRTANVP
jgi:hypothetical protein